MHGLLTITKRMNVLLFDFVLRGGQDTAGTIGIRGKTAFATAESRTSNVSGGLVNFLVYKPGWLVNKNPKVELW